MGRALIVVSLAAVLLTAGCADFELLFGREPTPSDTPPPDGEAPVVAEKSAQIEPPKAKVFKGTGEFIDREAASLPDIEVTSAGDVILNFAGADLRDVIRTILGTTLKRNYVLHPKVQGKVTVQTSRPLPRSALLPTLENILRLNDAALVQSEGIFKILPMALAPSASVKPRLGLPPGLRGRTFGIQIVPLQYVSANEMEKILKPFAAPGGILRVDAARNLLMLAGTRAELVNLLDIVDIFDVDWLAGRSVALFPLQTADPKSVIADLEQIFGGQTEGPLAGVVRFLPIDRLNAILVIATRPDYVDKAETWVERLDGGLESGERKIHVYPVQNGRAADLANILADIFSTRTESRSTGGQSQTSGRARGSSGAGGSSRRSTTTGGTSGTGTTGSQGSTAPSSTSSSTAAGQTTDQSAAERERARRGTATAQAGGRAGARSGAGPSAASSAGGSLRIIADETNNALVLLATPREYRDILAALKKLDIPPLQVLVEATVAEVTLDDDLSYGLQWFFNSGSSSFTQSATSTGTTASRFNLLSAASGGFSYVYNGLDIKVVLDALSAVTDVNVISSPSLMVLDNQTATIQVGDDVPVQTGATTNDAGTTSSIQFRNTGVILTVTPRVNAGGLVQMDIAQEVSDVVTTSTSSIDSPTIQQRRIESTVAIQSGETVALGGLIKDKKTIASAGLPFLSEIPILGALFGTRSNSVDRTELLVMITPRIVRNQAEARKVTRELRDRLRAIDPLGRRIE